MDVKAVNDGLAELRALAEEDGSLGWRLTEAHEALVNPA